MPIDPLIEAKRHLVEHVADARELYGSAQGRALLDEFSSGGTTFNPPTTRTQEHTLDAGHGAFNVRVYVPDSATATGSSLVWNHGGAFIGGDLDMAEADHVARVICDRGVLVVSVGYHLCLDGVHFPVPHDDVVAAWRWARDNADRLGTDPDRVSLGGASAGGALAAGAALHLRDDGDLPSVDRLLLVYPVLHSPPPSASADLRDRLSQLPSFMQPAGDEIHRQIAAHYLGQAHEGSAIDPHAFAAHGDVAGLPPTLVVTCEYDDLRPSGDAFARQLAEVGVEVEHVVEQGALHGHLNYLALTAGARTVERMLHCITG